MYCGGESDLGFLFELSVLLIMIRKWRAGKIYDDK